MYSDMVLIRVYSLSFAPCGSAFQVLLVDRQGCGLFHLWYSWCGIPLGFSLQAKVSMSLLILSIVGEGGVEPKFSPSWSRSVSD